MNPVSFLRSARLRWVLLALLAVAALPAWPAPMQPGLWELTMTVVVNGEPQTVPTARDCISQRDIDDGRKTLPRPEGACTLSNVQRTDERATYDLECRKDTVVTRGSADITFAPERYDGKVNLVVAGRNNTVLPIAMSLRATRMGECTK